MVWSMWSTTPVAGKTCCVSSSAKCLLMSSSSSSCFSSGASLWNEHPGYSVQNNMTQREHACPMSVQAREKQFDHDPSFDVCPKCFKRRYGGLAWQLGALDPSSVLAALKNWYRLGWEMLAAVQGTGRGPYQTRCKDQVLSRPITPLERHWWGIMTAKPLQKMRTTYCPYNYLGRYIFS